MTVDLDRLREQLGLAFPMGAPALRELVRAIEQMDAVLADLQYRVAALERGVARPPRITAP